MIDKAIRATTQEHLDIYTIAEHLVILKDGSVAMVLQTSAINFNLLSEEEQDATIFAYASLLNSLSFPVQILIRSTKKDLTVYLDLLDQKLEETKSQKIREQLVKYRTFIKDLVKENNVLEKRFYAVVPFSSLELGLKPSQVNPLAKPPQKPPYEQSYILNKAKLVLYPRRDHLIRQFARVGLKIKQLDTKELVALFYNIYNSDAQDSQTMEFISEETTEVPHAPAIATPPAVPQTQTHIVTTQAPVVKTPVTPNPQPAPVTPVVQTQPTPPIFKPMEMPSPAPTTTTVSPSTPF